MKTFLEHTLELQRIKYDKDVEPDEVLWNQWKALMNMNYKELETFYKKEDVSTTGFTPDQATSLLKMINYKNFDSASNEWTSDFWKELRILIIDINKILDKRVNLRGNPFEDKNGNLTPWIKKLLVRGHDPRKF